MSDADKVMLRFIGGALLVVLWMTCMELGKLLAR